jgi:hypothetical protein
MPKPSWHRRANKNRWGLPNAFPTSLTCRKVYIPDDEYYVSQLIGRLRTLQQQIWYDRDENHTAKDVAALWRDANQRTFAEFDDTCGTTEKPPPRFLYDSLPDCIRLLDTTGDGMIDTIEICESECDMPVTVNIYEGCCPNGKDPGLPSPGEKAPEGGNDFQPYPSPPEAQRTTACDAVTTTAPFILAQAKEFFNAVRQLVDAGTSAPEAMAEIIEFLPGATVPSGLAGWADELSEIGFQAIENFIEDVDFKLVYQEAFFNVFGVERYVTQITRQQLREVTGGLPTFWGNPLANGTIILPKVIFGGFHRIADLGKINANLAISKGTGQPPLCEYLYGETGITPPNIPSPVPVPNTEIFTFGDYGRTAYVVTVDQQPASQTDFIEMHEVLGDIVGLATLGWYGINAGGALSIRLQIRDSGGSAVYNPAANWGYCCVTPVVDTWSENGSLDANTQNAMDDLYAQIGRGATRQNVGTAPTNEQPGYTVGGAGTVNNGQVYYDKLIVIYDTSSL